MTYPISSDIIANPLLVALLRALSSCFGKAGAAEDKETGGIYLLFYIVHPSMPNLPFLQVSSNAYHEIAYSDRNLDEIFGKQGSNYLEVSQFIMNKRLRGGI